MRLPAIGLVFLCSITATIAFGRIGGQRAAPPPQVSALPYRVVPDFFQLPNEWHFGEVSGVAIDSHRHIFVFQRAAPMLSEFDANGKFLREIGAGLFTHPHGLRIDAQDNIWTTDDGSHLVLKLNHDGRPLLVLEERDRGGGGLAL